MWLVSKDREGVETFTTTFTPAVAVGAPAGMDATSSLFFSLALGIQLLTLESICWGCQGP